jgi:rhodanese-related sulfurtransferase
MAFKRSTSAAAIPSDPVQLYRKLAETNDGPANLWFHQGTVLLNWHKNHAAGHDVAIELPTGAGKTLVGGLIGDYRRRAFRERVVYLCPTRQLARQTANKLTEYGIPNVLLIGKVRKWNKADRARYTAANAIAVSVYSHVFNSNPALGDAQLLLLDDAHAAESAVAGPWSLEIDRTRDDSAYFDVRPAIVAGAVLAMWCLSPAQTRSTGLSCGLYFAPSISTPTINPRHRCCVHRLNPPNTPLASTPVRLPPPGCGCPLAARANAGTTRSPSRSSPPSRPSCSTGSRGPRKPRRTGQSSSMSKVGTTPAAGIPASATSASPPSKPPVTNRSIRQRDHTSLTLSVKTGQPQTAQQQDDVGGVDSLAYSTLGLTPGEQCSDGDVELAVVACAQVLPRGRFDRRHDPAFDARAR